MKKPKLKVSKQSFSEWFNGWNEVIKGIQLSDGNPKVKVKAKKIKAKTKK